MVAPRPIATGFSRWRRGGPAPLPALPRPALTSSCACV